MKIKVAVGLSGGIDSSFTAYLLKKKGFDVVGFTLKFYPQENRCCDLESLYQAQRLCDRLNIAHYVLDVEGLFKAEIINYFLDSYLKGFTPNPCAFCNRLIKFGYFFEKIRALGIDYLATGHYARLLKKNGLFFLGLAKDKKKTQEYFLSLINPQILKYLIFPLGSFTKEKVKELARKEKIMFKERKESQDICFVKKNSYINFIEENTPDFHQYRGDIQHISGKVLGSHKGIYRFTHGQREGLGVSWKEPLYVADIDSASRTIKVAEKRYLAEDKFTVSCLNWFDSPLLYKDILVKVRYNSLFHDCRLKLAGDKAIVLLNDKVEALTPGQIAVFYCKDMVLGAGIIQRN